MLMGALANKVVCRQVHWVFLLLLLLLLLL
jgi:hypothetical protein